MSSLSTRRRSPVDRSLVAKALNPSFFRRACRMAISRNAFSLLDFPEFAQAVRYGVPGTRLAIGISLVLSDQISEIPIMLRASQIAIPEGIPTAGELPPGFGVGLAEVNTHPFLDRQVGFFREILGQRRIKSHRCSLLRVSVGLTAEGTTYSPLCNATRVGGQAVRWGIGRRNPVCCATTIGGRRR